MAEVRNVVNNNNAIFFIISVLSIFTSNAHSLHIPIEEDVGPVLGCDEDGSVPIVKNIDIIEIPVFLVFNRHFDVVFLLITAGLITDDLSCEVETFPTAVRHGVGSSEEGKIGDDGVAIYFQGIRAGEVDGCSAGGMCALHGDGVVSVEKSFLHHHGLLLLSLRF